MTDIERALIHYDGNNDMPYCDLVWQALKEKKERDYPRPLSLDRMNALYHEPIYVLRIEGEWNLRNKNGWHIATSSNYQNHGRCDLAVDYGNAIFDMQDYGKAWVAYDYEPKHQTK